MTSPENQSTRNLWCRDQQPMVLLVVVLLVEHISICLGNTWISNPNDNAGGFLNKWGLTFGLALAFDIVAETWLDKARISTLDKQSCQLRSAILEAHQKRKQFHSTTEGATTLPWLGPGNWHYETSHCLRDALLSFSTLLLYIVDPHVFAIWWMPLVWGTYTADMLVLIVRKPAISPGWFRFVSLHHSMTGIFLTLSSFLSTQPLPSVVQGTALIWFSNVFTTAPIVYRSFCGVDYLTVRIAGFLVQRALRWTAAILAFVVTIDNPTLYLFSSPYFYAVNCVFFAGLEVVDIKSQLGTILRLQRNLSSKEHASDEEDITGDTDNNKEDRPTLPLEVSGPQPVQTSIMNPQSSSPESSRTVDPF